MNDGFVFISQSWILTFLDVKRCEAFDYSRIWMLNSIQSSMKVVPEDCTGATWEFAPRTESTQLREPWMTLKGKLWRFPVCVEVRDAEIPQQAAQHATSPAGSSCFHGAFQYLGTVVVAEQAIAWSRGQSRKETCPQHATARYYHVFFYYSTPVVRSHISLAATAKGQQAASIRTTHIHSSFQGELSPFTTVFGFSIPF